MFCSFSVKKCASPIIYAYQEHHGLVLQKRFLNSACSMSRAAPEATCKARAPTCLERQGAPARQGSRSSFSPYASSHSNFLSRLCPRHFPSKKPSSFTMNTCPLILFILPIEIFNRHQWKIKCKFALKTDQVQIFHLVKNWEVKLFGRGID